MKNYKRRIFSSEIDVNDLLNDYGKNMRILVKSGVPLTNEKGGFFHFDLDDGNRVRFNPESNEWQEVKIKRGKNNIDRKYDSEFEKGDANDFLKKYIERM